MAIRVKINANICTACASCVQIAPDVFVIENWTSTIKKKWRISENPYEGKVPNELLALLERAVHSCPVSAIMIINEAD